MGSITRTFANNITTGGNLTALDAAKLTGTVADARISTLTASKLTGTLPAISGASLTGIESGLTVADSWRLTANIGGTDAVITTSNIERSDSVGAGQIGSAMTYSSGIFTFPVTGYYLILFKANTSNSSGDETQFILQCEATTDNASYTVVSQALTSARPEHNNMTGSSWFVMDVSNTSTHKVRFSTSSHQTNTSLLGDTTMERTTFTFLRLGAT